MDTAKTWYMTPKRGDEIQENRRHSTSTAPDTQSIREQITRKREEMDAVREELRRAWAEVDKYESKRAHLLEQEKADLPHRPATFKQYYRMPGAFETGSEASSAPETRGQRAQMDKHEHETDSEASTIRLPLGDATRETVEDSIIGKSNGMRTAVRDRCEALVDMVEKEHFEAAVALLGGIMTDIVALQALKLRLKHVQVIDLGNLLFRLNEEMVDGEMSRQLRYDLDRVIWNMFHEVGNSKRSDASM
nr:hypothetical protein CFP56_69051 [Quercus suber]